MATQEAAAPKNGNFLSKEEVKYWLSIIVIVLALATAWTKQQQQVADLCVRVDKLTNQVETYREDRLKLETRLSAIETDLKYLRQWADRQD